MKYDIESRIIYFLQGNIPLDPRPYDGIAQSLGISAEEVIFHINRMQQNGIIRRLGAILRHHQAGFATNAMVAWQVDESRADEAGKIMAEFQAVSHCYWREVPKEFGCHLFTMIHARSDEELVKLIRQISDQTGIRDYQVLKSTRELKKVSMNYV